MQYTIKPNDSSVSLLEWGIDGEHEETEMSYDIETEQSNKNTDRKIS